MKTFGKKFDDSKYDKGWLAKKPIKLKLWGKLSKVRVKAIAQTSSEIVTVNQAKTFADFKKRLKEKQTVIETLFFDYYSKRNNDMADWGSDGLKRSEAAMADLGKEIVPVCLFIHPEKICENGSLVPAFCRLEIEQASYKDCGLYVNFYEKEPIISEKTFDW